MHAIIEEEIEKDENLAWAIFTLSAVAKEVLTAMRRNVETRNLIFKYSQACGNGYGHRISIKDPENNFRPLCHIDLDEKYNFVQMDNDMYYDEIVILANKINIR